MPSRVVVDGSGDAYVANRGFSMQGTVTKIAANIDDCVDRNGNGMIDTSTGSTALPFDEDECVLWTFLAFRTAGAKSYDDQNTRVTFFANALLGKPKLIQNGDGHAEIRPGPPQKRPFRRKKPSPPPGDRQGLGWLGGWWLVGWWLAGVRNFGVDKSNEAAI